MSESFIAAFLVALIIVVFWRVALPILLAILLALLVTGVGAVARVVAGGDDGRSQVVAPAEPGLGGQAGSEPPR
jgi:hypothetical protein